MPPTPAPKVNMEAPEDRFTILGLHFDESSSLGERENAKEKLLRFKLFLDPVPVLIYIRFSRPEPGLEPGGGGEGWKPGLYGCLDLREVLSQHVP